MLEPDREPLSSDELNQGLDRLTPPERETLAPLIGNVENQGTFRELVQDIGRDKIQRLLDQAFPDRRVTPTDLRFSLAAQMIREGYSRDEVRHTIHGNTERVVELGKSTTKSQNEGDNQ